MPDLLVEIGTEELPPRDLRPVMSQLADGVRQMLQELRIAAGEVKCVGTPRRIVIHCTDVATRQQPTVREVRGPAASAAFDASGRPTQAAIGFARSQGVPVERLRVEQVGGRRYVVAVIEEGGRSTVAVVPEALARVLAGLTFSKTMRWGAGEARFVRPVRWVLALLGEQRLRLEVAGVRVGPNTFGHRTLDGGPRPVKSVRDYFRILRESKVIIDPDERRRRIETQAKALAAQVDGIPLLDPLLLEETLMSVEHPQALRGALDRAFLSLPREILITVMQHHQKYFPVEDRQHRLQPYFIAVRDGGRRHLATVRQGHQWVLQARLADARFFFEEDRKRRLEEYVPMLKGLVFQAQLGTMADKTRRLVALARQLAGILLLDGHTTEALLRAAMLCKADLVTHLVGEFPELQGTIGQIYAELDGEPTEVARAIGEHYHPTGAGDSAPKTQTGALLGLIEKCDTLVGALTAGLTVTGSQDPYGLRRAAQGIVEIIMMLRLRIPLSTLLAAAAQGYGQVSAHLVEETLDFVRQRLAALLMARGLRYDLVDAAVAVSGDDLLAVGDRAESLQSFSVHDEFPQLYVAYDRASRILSAETDGGIDPGLFEAEAERELFEVVSAVGPGVRQSAASGDYLQALAALHVLAEPVDRIFDDVLIMAPDARVRANRLALLRSVVELFRLVADFSRVVMAEQKTGEPGTGQRTKG